MSRPPSSPVKPRAGASCLAGVPGRDGAGLSGWLHGLATQVRQLFVPAVGFSRSGLAQVERLVFVCHANLYRSALAQVLCEQAGLKAASFGLHTLTGGRSPTAAVRGAAALGVRLEAHRATHRRDFKPSDGDLYLVMSPRQARSLVHWGFPAERIALLGLWCGPARLHIEDAHGEGDAALRQCFARVHEATIALGEEWCRARVQAPAASGYDAADGLDTPARV